MSVVLSASKGGFSVTALPAVLATRNPGKLAELAPLLLSFGIPVVTLADIGVEEKPRDEDALEQFDTFEANALAKAHHFSRLTGRMVFADDSGLMVDALGGEPGVHSKRWSGRPDLSGADLERENNALLQHRLSEASRAGRHSRTARYVCAAACVWPSGVTSTGTEVVVVGQTHGRIVNEPVGSGGFGYDPYFFSDDLGATFAAVTRESKEQISHRGRAFHRLIANALLRAAVQAMADA